MRNVYVSTSFDSKMLLTPSLASRVRMATVPYERVLKLLNGAARQLIFISDSVQEAVSLAQSIPVPTALGISYSTTHIRFLDKGDIMLASARPGNHNEWIIIDILKDVAYALTLDTTLEKDIDGVFQTLERAKCPIINAPAALKYQGHGELSQQVEALIDVSLEQAAKDYIETHGKRRGTLYRDKFVCAVAMQRLWG